MTAPVISTPGAGVAPRKLDLNLFDTHVGIWQANATDPTFKAEIFDGLVKLFGRLGWKVTADPRVLKHHRCISKYHRLAERGSLRAAIEIGGCCIKIEFWSEASPQDNSNGRRYDFDKRKRAPYLDRLRIDLETRRILDWLRGRAVLTETRRARSGEVAPGAMTAMEFIAEDYRTSWHSDKDLGRPLAKHNYNCTSRDGDEIGHGQKVWFRGRGGRLFCGTAYYNINNMWWIVSGEWSLSNKSTGEIYTRQPGNLRKKDNGRERRKRLEQELAIAIRAMNFTRAETLRRILFGTDLTYGIWSKDKEAYYRADYCGYTADGISAGRYTWDEAAREVLRCPSELRIVLPDGSRLTADQIIASLPSPLPTPAE